MFSRVVRLVAGCSMIGLAVSLMVRARLGLGPWDVLHQGIAEHTGIGIGTVGILVGVVVLACWIPLRERPGVGTLTNMVVIGLVIDAVLAVLHEPASLALRVAYLVAGVAVFGPGIATYVGAALGPGPRDGIMTNLARRGLSIRVARTLVELGALAGGFALGGTVGAGTLLYAFAIGPTTQFWMQRFPGEFAVAERASAAPLH